jgi:hypothetical protein
LAKHRIDSVSGLEELKMRKTVKDMCLNLEIDRIMSAHAKNEGFRPFEISQSDERSIFALK